MKPIARRRLLLSSVVVAILATAGALLYPYIAYWRSEPPVVSPDTARLGSIETAPVVAPDRINLVLFGDWGKNSPEERQVARGIFAYGAHFDAGLLLGDNFYVPLTGVEDPRWRSLFEDLYQPADLRFWAVLGNHDYLTPAGPKPPPGVKPKVRLMNKDVELEYAHLHPGGRFNLPARWYRLDLPAEDPTVAVLMLDSNYRDPSLFSEADWKAEGDWLVKQLDELRPGDPNAPRRRWVVCCAHHPIFTNGIGHADDSRLKREWLPLFESHGVDFYLTGHNHCMEHVQPPESKVSYVVAGGGGAVHACHGQPPPRLVRQHARLHPPAPDARLGRGHVRRFGRKPDLPFHALGRRRRARDVNDDPADRRAGGDAETPPRAGGGGG